MQKRPAYLIASGSALNDARILKQARAIAGSGRAAVIFHFAGDHDQSDCGDLGAATAIAVDIASQRRAASVAAALTMAALFAVAAVVSRLFGLSFLSFVVGWMVAGAAAGVALYWRVRGASRPGDAIRRVLRGVDHRLKARALGRAIKRAGAPFIIHAHEPAALALVQRLDLFSVAPVIYDAHELYEDMAGGRAEDADGVARIHGESMARAARVIVVSDNISKYYAQRYGVEAPLVIANATPRLALSSYDGRLHAAAGFGVGGKVLLYHGGMTEGRGLFDLLDAIALAPEEWRLVMMGDGPLRDSLRRHASARAGDRVAFIPPAPHAELSAWVQGATLGVIPYEDTCLNHRYCAPNKLWEYPSAGAPVLARNLESLGAMVREYAIGWTFDDGEDAPARIAARLADLDERALAEARAACAAFMEKNDWRRYENRLLALYDEIDSSDRLGLSSL